MSTPYSASVPPEAPPQTRTVEAMLWMAASGLLFVGVTAIVKHLGGSLPAAQSAFVRYALGLVFLIMPVLSLLRSPPRGVALRLSILRGAAHAIGVILWFFAMAQITLAEVTAMNYLSPIYVALGAAVFLGERIYLRRAAAIGVALLGALVILRPGFRELEPGHFAMMGTAILFAISFLVAKRLTAMVSATSVVTTLSIGVTVGLAPFAFAVWEPITLTEVAWLFLTAGLATAGHYAMTYAFGAAPMAVTQPVTFLQLIWAVLLGALAFGEPVDIWVVTGGAMILGSVCFIAWREYRLKQAGRL